MGHTGHLGRYWIVGFISLPFLRMLIKSLPPASSAKELEWPLLAGMRCPNNLLFFVRFGVPKALISDQVSHFCNKAMSTLLEKFGVVHRVATAYHPQTNGNVPLTDSFCKACHLLVEIEHRAYWTVKGCNLAFDQVGKERKLQLQELEELFLEAYENSKVYKKKVKRFHDNMILRDEFKVSQKELLFNCCLKLIVVEINFKVNRHQLKLFHEYPTMTEGDVEELSLYPKRMVLGECAQILDLQNNITVRYRHSILHLDDLLDELVDTIRLG
ncbi:hypothetical protein CR513_48605, partial [Mucuna pruriens]